jgi:hypothetical protein
LKVSPFESRPKLEKQKKRRTFVNLSEKTPKFLRIISEKNCEKVSNLPSKIAKNRRKFLRVIAKKSTKKNYLDLSQQTKKT